jgi:ATP-GRASP peptide maturase of grasp-with-spasm system
MILIITDQNDSSSTKVIDWLLFYDVKFLRISEADVVTIDFVDPDNDEGVDLEIRGEKYNLKNFKSIWYRRSYLNIESVLYKGMTNHTLNDAINYQLESEKNVLKEYVLKAFKKKSLNSEFDNSLNKLEVLNLCKKFDIKTPASIVTTRKDKLIEFKNKYPNIVTKNFTPGVFFKSKKVYISPITNVVTDQMIEFVSDKFYPMLFQEMIAKSFEVRTFFLNTDFYSSAIFSQNDEKTKVDFRNYNIENPNRTPPFKLPKEMEIKLGNLMKAIQLNSGSIDLIVTPQGEFIFLEVNPIGLFSQVSRPCNYNIEKKIANYLTV